MEEILKAIKSKIILKDMDNVLVNEGSSFNLTSDSFQSIEDGSKNDPICFIDGGQGNIILAPSLALSLMKVYATKYSGNKRMESRLFKFYSLIYLTKSDEDLFFKFEIINIKEKIILPPYKFNISDPALIKGQNFVSIQSVIDLIRRCSELYVASLSDAKTIIDGSLETKHQYEKNILSKILDISGLCKTNTMLTKSGQSLMMHLNKIAPNKAWYCKIAASQFETFAVKLHEDSGYIFRFDTTQKDIKNTLSLLKRNSVDPVFIGYPYGLVEADKFARVENSEINAMKFKFRAILKDSNLDSGLNSLNAHDILDNIF